MPKLSKREKCRRAALLQASQVDYDGVKQTEAGRAAAWQTWLSRVDPDGILPLAEREVKARRLRQATMLGGRGKPKQKGRAQ